MTWVTRSYPNSPALKQGGGVTGQKEGEFSTVPGEAQKEGEFGTAFGKLKEAYVHCRTCEGACYYYTALYVGLTLLRTPATANTESTTHTQLKECVEALDRVQRPPEIFQAEVAAMRKMVRRPGEDAAPAEVMAQAAGSSKQTPTKPPQKPAEETPAHSEKRKMPEASPQQTPKKKARA